jgi:uncharacterized protein (DUF2236 family)
MQIAEPTIAEGLHYHETTLVKNPVKRLIQTIEFLCMPVGIKLEKEISHENPKQFDQALKYYFGIHKHVKQFTPELRTFVWSTIIMNTFPIRNMCRYPLTDEQNQQLYERLVQVGTRVLGTTDEYPASYHTFISDFKHQLSELKKTEISEKLTRVMIEPEQGGIVFKMMSWMLKPLNKRIIDSSIKKEFKIEESSLDRVLGLVLLMLLNVMREVLPAKLQSADTLVKTLRLLLPTHVSIYVK